MRSATGPIFHVNGLHEIYGISHEIVMRSHDFFRTGKEQIAALMIEHLVERRNLYQREVLVDRSDFWQTWQGVGILVCASWSMFDRKIEFLQEQMPIVREGWEGPK